VDDSSALQACFPNVDFFITNKPRNALCNSKCFELSKLTVSTGPIGAYNVHVLLTMATDGVGQKGCQRILCTCSFIRYFTALCWCTACKVGVFVYAAQISILKPFSSNKARPRISSSVPAFLPVRLNLSFASSTDVQSLQRSRPVHDRVERNHPRVDAR
jgi:hypothetical protein